MKVYYPSIDFRCDHKRSAQLVNVNVWKNLSGREFLARDEQYWTLMDDRSFELETLEKEKFLIREQFHGVNRDKIKHDECKRLFTGINTYLGDWADVMRHHNPCANGGVVYLDTMCQIDKISPTASTLLLATLESVGPRSLVSANYCLNNPRNPTGVISPDVFLDRLKKFEFNTAEYSWEHLKFDDSDAYLPEKTSLTQMITFFFWRSR